VTLVRHSELTKLYRRIKNATKAYGKKKALAGFLGVSSQQLSNWISEINEPGGEATLLMLEWVTAEEAKQNKNRSSALTPLRRKTRSRKTSKNENLKSSRP
jgi:hypothetical protein